MSPEVTVKNEAWIEKHKAKREARAAAKAVKKLKKFVQPKPEAVKAAVKEHVKSLQEQASAKKVAGLVSPNELKAAVKAKFPGIKGSADAAREELKRVLQANQGDSIIAELQETWAKRSQARHEAWIRGTSKSALAARANQTT